MIKKLKKDEEAQISESLKTNHLMVLIFLSRWSGPCEIYEKFIYEIEKDNSHGVDFLLIDLDETPDISKKFNISKFPSTLFFKNQKQVLEKDGLIARNELINTIQFLNN